VAWQYLGSGPVLWLCLPLCHVRIASIAHVFTSVLPKHTTCKTFSLLCVYSYYCTVFKDYDALNEEVLEV
jgi:hypothetical protein